MLENDDNSLIIACQDVIYGFSHKLGCPCDEFTISAFNQLVLQFVAQ